DRRARAGRAARSARASGPTRPLHLHLGTLDMQADDARAAIARPADHRRGEPPSDAAASCPPDLGHAASVAGRSPDDYAAAPPSSSPRAAHAARSFWSARARTRQTPDSESPTR